MKYFLLSDSINNKEIGCFPQSQTFINVGSLRDDDLLMRNGLINRKIIIPELQLMNKAIPSTIISSPVNNSNFLVTKNYFIEFLRNYKLGKIQYWNLLVHHKKHILNDYSLFYMFNKNQDDFINFKDSKFLVGSGDDYFTRKNYNLVKINNYNDYIKMKEMLKDEGLIIISDELILYLSNLDLDMFRLNVHTGGYFVSERLKDAIEQNRFTGMRFQEIEEFNSNIKVIY